MMKTLFVLMALVCAAFADTYKCSVDSGGNLLTNSAGQRLKIDFPCKFPMVDQTCGAYRVTVTPGLVDADHRFFVNTIWLEVTDTTSGKTWQGRTSNRIVTRYLDEDGKLQEPLVQRNGDDSNAFSTNNLFNFEKSGAGVTIKEKNQAFTISFTPYSEKKGHKSVKLEYRCDAGGEFPPYPKQFCGGGDSKETSRLAVEKGIIEKEKQFKNDAASMLSYLQVFTDLDTDQTPSPQCKVAAEVMSTCPDQLGALNVCHTILSSEKHRQCAAGFSCGVIDVFVDCLKMVCSDLKDKEACQRVGDAIEYCRDFPGLTPLVDQCYRGDVIPNQ